MKLLVRVRHRWEEDTEGDLRNIVCGDMNGIEVAEDRVKDGILYTVIKFWVV